MDCNVGGYFGPFLKFAGFDALMVTGRALEDVIVLLDAVAGRVTIETAPEESIDSHVLAEELTEMYADNEVDRRNVAVVSSGRGAQHTRLGVLNFSFYDWRRRVPRLKQAGRGGIGTVFRDKRIKALVLKNRGVTPAWRVSESRAETGVTSSICGESGTVDAAAVREIVAHHDSDPDRIVAMMQDVQDRDGYISGISVRELCLGTGIPEGKLYHIATFYEALTLAPAKEGAGDGERALDQMASLVNQQLFGLRAAGMASADNIESYLAPGALGLIRKLLKEVAPDKVDRSAVNSALGAGSGRAAGGEFTLKGALRNCGSVVVSGETTLGRAIDDFGGGLANGRTLQAIVLGGPAGECIPAADLDMEATLDSLAHHGLRSGNGDILVLDDTACIPETVSGAVKMLAAQSCGTCTPCREGLQGLAATLGAICDGEGKQGDIEFIEEVAETIRVTSLCRFGATAVIPVLSSIGCFRSEYEGLLRGENCPAQRPGTDDKEVN